MAGLAAALAEHGLAATEEGDTEDWNAAPVIASSLLDTHGFVVQAARTDGYAVVVDARRAKGDQKDHRCTIKTTSDSSLVPLLRSEYEFLMRIKSPNVVRPLELLAIEPNLLAIVFDATPHISLRELIHRNGRFAIRAFVAAAKQICAAVQATHDAKICHYDLSSHNLLVEHGGENDGHVLLTNFHNAEFMRAGGRLVMASVNQSSALGVSSGRPSVLTSPRDSRAGGEFLQQDDFEGVLAQPKSLDYLAPERTRRVKREPDYRADLYSMGAVFYEMLAGRPPFLGDAYAIVHAHIALVPDSLHSTNGVPVFIDRIIQKLLRKDPDERYQSGRGVLADLELFESKGFNALLSTAIAQMDVPYRLPMPSELFGRTSEQKKICDAVSDAFTSQVARVVMLDGPSGVGKSSLVRAACADFTGKCTYAEGKYDQYGAGRPFSAIVDILALMTGQLIAKTTRSGGTALLVTLRNAVGKNASALCQLHPAMASLFGRLARRSSSGLSASGGSEPLLPPFSGERASGNDCAPPGSVIVSGDTLSILVHPPIQGQANSLKNTLSATGSSSNLGGGGGSTSNQGNLMVRLQQAFCSLLKALASCNCPALLVLDDLQWADASSLRLLQHAALQTDCPFALVATYRTSEITPSHPLHQIISSSSLAGSGRLLQLSLGSLTVEDVTALIARSTALPLRVVSDLATIVHNKTAGNPFFIGHFLSALQDDGLLFFDPARHRWAWKLADIKSCEHTENVVDFIVDRSSRALGLREETQALLKYAAVIGCRFTLDGVAALAHVSEDDAHARLQDALAEGLVMRLAAHEDRAAANRTASGLTISKRRSGRELVASLSNAMEDVGPDGLFRPFNVPEDKKLRVSRSYAGLSRSQAVSLESAEATEESFEQSRVFAFVHDRVQQAFYQLLSEEQKTLVHFDLAKILLASSLLPDSHASPRSRTMPATAVRPERRPSDSGVLPAKRTSTDSRRRSTGATTNSSTSSSLGADDSERVFAIAGHLLRCGVHAEKLPDLAAMQLANAGTLAVNAAAYDEALKYFNRAKSLLPLCSEASRERHTFTLYFNQPACLYFLGHHYAASKGLEEARVIAGNNHSLVVPVMLLQISVYTAMARYSDAMSVGLDCLDILGCEMPVNIDAEAVAAEIESIDDVIVERDLAELVAESAMDKGLFPSSEMWRVQALDTALMELIPVALLLGDINAYVLFSARVTALAFARGHTVASSGGMCVYGFTLAGVLGRHRLGCQVVQVGTKLAETYGDAAHLGRSYLHAGLAMPWGESFDASIAALKKALAHSSEAADQNYRVLVCVFLTWTNFIRGTPLAAQATQLGIHAGLVTASGQRDMMRAIGAVRGVVEELTGVKIGYDGMPSAAGGGGGSGGAAAANSDDADDGNEYTPFANAAVGLFRTLGHVVFGRDDRAFAVYSRLVEENTMEHVRGLITHHEFDFVGAIAAARKCRRIVDKYRDPNNPAHSISFAVPSDSNPASSTSGAAASSSTSGASPSGDEDTPLASFISAAGRSSTGESRQIPLPPDVAAQVADLMSKVKNHVTKLEDCSQASRRNYFSKCMLARAEAKRLEGRYGDALAAYGQAARLARDEMFWHVAALAYEGAADLLIAGGMVDLASPVLLEAATAYTTWGATVKVDELYRRYPELHRGRKARAATSATGMPRAHTESMSQKTSATGAPGGSSIDLVALFRAARALSEEMEFDKLQTVLLDIIAQNCGADHAALVLVRDEPPEPATPLRRSDSAQGGRYPSRPSSRLRTESVDEVEEPCEREPVRAPPRSPTMQQAPRRRMAGRVSPMMASVSEPVQAVQPPPQMEALHMQQVMQMQQAQQVQQAAPLSPRQISLPRQQQSPRESELRAPESPPPPQHPLRVEQPQPAQQQQQQQQQLQVDLQSRNSIDSIESRETRPSLAPQGRVQRVRATSELPPCIDRQPLSPLLPRGVLLKQLNVDGHLDGGDGNSSSNNRSSLPNVGSAPKVESPIVKRRRGGSVGGAMKPSLAIDFGRRTSLGALTSPRLTANLYIAARFTEGICSCEDEPVDRHPHVSAAIIGYVAGTRESLLIEDTRRPMVIGEDPHVVRAGVACAMCVPLQRGGEFQGALYLENRRTPHAFNADRLWILELLSKQVAVSLKNAALFRSMKAARDEMVVARNFSESILRSTRDPMLVLDSNLRCVTANRAFLKMFYMTDSEVRGRSIYELAGGQFGSNERLKRSVDAILRCGEPFKDVEVKITTSNQNMLTGSSMGTDDLQMSLASAMFAAIGGQTASAANSVQAFDLIVAGSQVRTAAGLSHSSHVGSWGLGLSNAPSLIEVHSPPGSDSDDGSFGDGNRVIILTMENVTHAKRALELRRTAGDLRRMIDGASVPIFGIDMSGSVVEWNERMRWVSGIRKDHAIGSPLASFLLFSESNPNPARFVSELVDSVAEGNAPNGIELSFRTNRGEGADLLVNVSPRMSGEGELVGVMMVGQDVSDKKHSESVLRQGLVASLTAFVPRSVAERYSRNPNLPLRSPACEYIEGAVLFADISDFTTYTEGMVRDLTDGAEKIAMFLDGVFDSLIPIISANGGDVIKFAGDAIAAVFPCTAKRNLVATTLQAIQCSITLVRAVKRIIMMRGFSCRLKVGIGAGQTTIVHIGSGGCWQQVFVGPAVAQMARSEKVAKPNQVLISPEAKALLPDGACDLEPVYAGTHAADGDGTASHAPPVVAYIVERMVGAELDPHPLPAPRLSSSMEAALKAYVPVQVYNYVHENKTEWLTDLRSITVVFMNIGGIDFSKGFSNRRLGASDFSASTPAASALPNPQRRMSLGVPFYAASNARGRMDMDDTELSFFEASEGDDPVLDTARKLSDAFDVIRSGVDAFEGSISKFLVDDKGLVAHLAFGLPQKTHSDDVTRAVLTCTRVVSQLEKRGFRARAGVATGTAFCGSVGSQDRKEYTHHSDIVNCAARLMVVSDWGRVLCDEATVDAAIIDNVEFEPKRELKLKGKELVLTASYVKAAREGKRGYIAHTHAVLASLAKMRRRRASSVEEEPADGDESSSADPFPSNNTQMMGREILLSDLIEASDLFASSMTPTFSAIFLTGEGGIHGIGKTRLLAEAHQQISLDDRIRETGVFICNYAFSRIGNARPLEMWVGLYEALVGRKGRDAIETARNDLIAGKDGRLAALMPLISDLFSHGRARDYFFAPPAGGSSTHAQSHHGRLNPGAPLGSPGNSGEDSLSDDEEDALRQGVSSSMSIPARLAASVKILCKLLTRRLRSLHKGVIIFVDDADFFDEHSVSVLEHLYSANLHALMICAVRSSSSPMASFERMPKSPWMETMVLSRLTREEMSPSVRERILSHLRARHPPTGTAGFSRRDSRKGDKRGGAHGRQNAHANADSATTTTVYDGIASEDVQAAELAIARIVERSSGVPLVAHLLTLTFLKHFDDEKAQKAATPLEADEDSAPTRTSSVEGASNGAALPAPALLPLRVTSIGADSGVSSPLSQSLQSLRTNSSSLSDSDGLTASKAPASLLVSLLGELNLIRPHFASRIDRLTPSQQVTLKIASVIGDSFGVDLLVHMTSSFERGGIQVIDDLDNLVASGFLVPGGDAPSHPHLKASDSSSSLLAPTDTGPAGRSPLAVHSNSSLASASHHSIDPLASSGGLRPSGSTEYYDMYTFAEQSIRETAYDMVLHRLRRRLHRDAALWYERVYGTHRMSREMLSTVAWHWQHADELRKYLEYLALAGAVSSRELGSWLEEDERIEAEIRRLEEARIMLVEKMKRKQGQARRRSSDALLL